MNIDETYIVLYMTGKTQIHGSPYDCQEKYLTLRIEFTAGCRESITSYGIKVVGLPSPSRLSPTFLCFAGMPSNFGVTVKGVEAA